MVKLNKIYTRTGDDGTTGLGSGERRIKCDLRIEAYGTVDEANAALGLALLNTNSEPKIHEILITVQNDLFDLGADLAVPETDKKPEYERLTVTDGQVERLEKAIDELNAGLEPLRSFILPGGSALSAYLHLARTIVRRAERLTVALMQEPGEIVNPAAVRYLNRLSDLLFVASRIANNNGKSDILWVPGKNR